MTESAASAPHEYAGPVAAGFVSFTEVLDDAHRAYNEWHMLDHMPEQRPLPGVRNGERWVIAPDCVAARLAAAGSLADCHYLTLYLMAEPLAATLSDFYRRGAELHRVGRFFDRRVSHLAGPLRVTGAWASPRVQISAAAVPYRPNRGVFVVAEQHDELPNGIGVGSAAPALLELDGVAGIWTFESDDHLGAVEHTAGNWRMAVAYLDEDPIDVARRSGDRLVAGLATAGVEPAYAGPLRSIRPGEWDWFGSDGG